MSLMMRSMLQVCGSLVAGGASLMAGGASLMAGGASLVAGGVPPWWCWCDPRWLVLHPGILGRIFTAGHPDRGTHPPISAAALAVEIQVSKE